MSEFRRVTDSFSVAPQIVIEDIARARAEGFVLVINNRPDDEVPDQVASADVAAACEEQGLAYIWMPFVGPPRRELAEMMHEAVSEAPGPVLAFCRSGTRCINIWALGEALSGSRTPEELVRLGFAAGYDLRPLLGG
jgi:uncharacterized protein (TIGR01244 family)